MTRIRDLSDEALTERRRRVQEAIYGGLVTLQEIAIEEARRRCSSGRIDENLAAPQSHGAAKTE
jgi:hypothetical protein